MIIYEVTPDGDKVAVRHVNVSPDFVGFNKFGAMSIPRFVELAHDLEPKLRHIEVEVIDA